VRDEDGHDLHVRVVRLEERHQGLQRVLHLVHVVVHDAVIEADAGQQVLAQRRHLHRPVGPAPGGETVEHQPVAAVEGARLVEHAEEHHHRRPHARQRELIEAAGVVVVVVGADGGHEPRLGVGPAVLGPERGLPRRGGRGGLGADHVHLRGGAGETHCVHLAAGGRRGLEPHLGQQLRPVVGRPMGRASDHEAQDRAGHQSELPQHGFPPPDDRMRKLIL